MEQLSMSIEVPLARLEEDLDDPSSFDYGFRYLPDNLYVFKREDLGDSELDKQRTFYFTDEKLNEVKRAYLDNETKLSNHLEIAVVDAESGNVDYQLERELKCLGCFRPFRKAVLKIRSVNGDELFSLKETKSNQVFEFSPLTGEKFILRRADNLDKVFEILAGDNNSVKLGSIAKRYMPINRRIRTRDGHYHIKFNENAADISDDIKYVLVLGIFLLVSHLH